jgi:hypothetical protein
VGEQANKWTPTIAGSPTEHNHEKSFLLYISWKRRALGADEYLQGCLSHLMVKNNLEKSAVGRRMYKGGIISCSPSFARLGQNIPDEREQGI